MTIDRAELEHLAQLAELTLPDGEVQVLAEHITRILAFVRAIDAIPGEAGTPFRPGPAAAPLRPDTASPETIVETPGDFAPEFDEGFFWVPKLPGVGDDVE